VHFPKVFDLRKSTFKSALVENATFDKRVGELPMTPEFHSCFISYSNPDTVFAERLHAALRKNGVACWYAPEDMKIGDECRERIEKAIGKHDKLLLILSEHSVKSAWVRDEVEACLERERLKHRQILFPIRLDDAAMRTRKAWAANIRRQRHIGDFRDWSDGGKYRQASSDCCGT
jgi:TIR domain-containing protein